jgi:ABC-2 type transport system ATP-binding protein
VAHLRRRATVGAGGRGGSSALSAIVTRGLSKRYGAVAAVDTLDLSIEAGTLYGFLGPNGAGKTTTIRMLLGLIFPSEGEVEVLGRPVFGGADGRASLRRVGAIVEEPAFWGYLSGRTNLQCFARAAGPVEDRRARLERIDDVLKAVDLTEAASKKVKRYSQGMRQRLGIALALLGAPELLILDEPTNGLDPGGMREVRLLLRRLAGEGITVFVSSHLLSEVEAMCDRVGVLARGRLVADGPPSNLRPAGDRLRVEVDDRDRALSVLSGTPGVEVESDGVEPDPSGRWRIRVRLSSPASAAVVNTRLVTAGIQVSALVSEHERLEDVFVDLVEGADVPR